MNMDFSLSSKPTILSIAGECDEDEQNIQSDSDSPRARMRVEGQASMEERQEPSLATSDGIPEEEKDLPSMAINQKDMVEELGEMVKALQETHERIKKEAAQLAAKLKKIEQEDTVCMVCHDVVTNPQILSCGHSACYACLRNWWTQPHQHEPAEMIDTEAESDIDVEPIVALAPNGEGGEPVPEQPPRPRRRHRFLSTVHCKKLCPYCRKEITHRPAPNLQLRAVVETLTQDAAPPPPHVHAPLTRRPDLWHGIFHVENRENHFAQPQPHTPTPPPRVEPELGPAPPPHPDPILNHIAQEQYRRAAAAAAARRERGFTEAFENGRTVGRAEVQQRWDRERANRAQQAAIGGDLAARSLLLLPRVVLPRQPNDEAAM